MFDKLTTNKNAEYDFESKTFSDKNLEEFFIHHVGGYEDWYLKVRSLWDNFTNKTVEWYPHLTVFIENFTENYLWHAKIEEYKIRKFTATKQGMKDLIPYVDRYIKNSTFGKLQLFEANMLQIRDILETDFNLTESALENFVKQQDSKYHELCYKPKYLLDRGSLKTAIAPKLFEICVDSVNAEKKKYLKADDAIKLEEMREYFANEQCAAREICSNSTSTALEFLNDKLEPYIAWFRKVAGGNELEGNKKIKDEIDITVFDSIERVLKKQKEFKDLSIKCIIDYMKRSQSLDKIYSSALLFDDDKLAKEINPIISQYKNLYSKAL